jgi:uncharacterized repeat protein (TIGR03843 family)
VLRGGPLGPGSVQWWVEQDPERLADPSAGLVEVVDPEQLRDQGHRWLPVVHGEGEDGAAVVVVHADDDRLRSMAVLDAVLNNADRKAAHLTLDRQGRLRGFDHGVCLHAQDKLRTVLWGWAGDPLPGTETARLRALDAALPGAGLSRLLDPVEIQALTDRCQALLLGGTHPGLPGDRYPLPWPLW